MIPELFQFLRPEWLWALLVIPVFVWVFYKHRVNNTGQWQQVCDPHLIKHVMVGSGKKQTGWLLFLFVIVWILAIISLAGPVWEKRPQPVFKSPVATVIILDLSPTMLAQDVKPARINLARFKILDFLDKYKEGQTALVVFSNDAFVISPLTDDAATIAAMVPGLDSSIMPEHGKKTSRGLRLAAELLSNASVQNGNIILITDGIGDKSSTLQVAKELQIKGHVISVLAVGDTEAVPIPGTDGKYLKDQSGKMQTTKLDELALQELTRIAGGTYRRITHDDSDIEQIIEMQQQPDDITKARQVEQQTDQWLEEGPWLLVVLLPLAALSFRRGWLIVIVLAVSLHADPSMALEWEDLWLTADQQAEKDMQNNQPDVAAQKFTRKNWRGAALYEAGEYEAATKVLSELENVDDQYNLANSLAKSGKLEEALNVYNKVLSQKPGMEDASFNRDLVEKLLKQQQKQQQQQQEQQSDQDQEQKDSNQQQQQSSQESGEQSEEPEEQPSDQQQQSDSDNSDSADQSGMNKDDQQQQQQNSGDENKQAEEEKENQQEQQSAQQNETEQESEEPDPGKAESQQVEQQDKSESQQALEQWLRKVPDDPGGLLRRKLYIEHLRRQQGR